MRIREIKLNHTALWQITGHSVSMMSKPEMLRILSSYRTLWRSQVLPQAHLVSGEKGCNKLNPQMVALYRRVAVWHGQLWDTACTTDGMQLCHEWTSWATLHTCPDWLAHCLVQAIFLLYTTGLHNSCDRWPACIVETPLALAGSRIAGQRFGLLMWVGLRNLAIVSLHGK